MCSGGVCFGVVKGVLWWYLVAGTRFDGRGTYLTGSLRRWWVKAVGSDGGWGWEWGSGRFAGIEDVGML